MPELKVVKKELEEPQRVMPFADEDMTDDALEREWMARLNAKPAKSNMRRSVIYEELWCAFSPDELDVLALAALTADREKQSLEEEHSSLASQSNALKKEIEGKGAEIRRNRILHDSGGEMRDVQVQKEINYDDGLVTFIRLDTGEELRTRPLDPSERQMKMGLE